MLTSGNLKPKYPAGPTQDVFGGGSSWGPSPGTPAAPTPAPMPINPSYTAALNAANDTYANTLAGIAAQRPLVQGAYGYDAQGNIDPNNPYSRAALLQRSYQNQQRANTNSYAARGQLYAGSLQNAQNEAQRGYQQSDAALRGEYAQQLAALAGAQLNANSQLGDSLASAAADNVNYAAGTDAPVAPAPAIDPTFAAKVAAGDPATLAFILKIATDNAQPSGKAYRF